MNSSNKYADKLNMLDMLAEDVLDISRNRLLVNMRYMDTALTFHERRSYNGSISVSGSTLYFDPVFAARTYRDSKEALTRIYLHAVLHCVFMHPFMCGGRERRLWDLACDIAAESVICELDLPCTRTDEDARRKDMLKKIRRETGFLTAEKVYAAVRKGELAAADSGEKKEELERLFHGDEHFIWYNSDTDPIDTKIPPDSILMTQDDMTYAEKWKQTARHIEMEIETFAKVRGRYASSMVQNLREVNRERYDYAEFLRKFAAVSETVKVSDDEFDYIYYNYGLQHYRNMPLIEPLEYREDKRIRDFVVAIDTSGSVAGDEVQSFISRTYNILRSREAFYEKINVHIVQCDAKVQSDAVITCTDDLERYLETMEIRGLGGTDFRPVFDYVDGLLKDGVFSDLKGLIYFTDGLGTYPPAKPDYRTAFVFVESGFIIPEVPVWAMKVILRPEEI